MNLDEKVAKMQLHTAALGFAAQVEVGVKSADSEGEIGAFEAYEGASDHLVTTALEYAGAAGSLDGAERAELDALRRFRDGVIALRGEMAVGRAADGDAIVDADARYFAVETIDALLAVSYPPIDPAPDDPVDPNKPTGGVHPRGIA